ncbi:hypothetical protein CEUSTIGMA_g13421.t1 [Chlamydomonas eustigma]|uniref:Replication origin-binding protein domain-containing protein n=1 Tax=Chlamydomonas eustigma TaxID=1157962 RepID=A0A250XSH4_9CHLO|nr:hypothetical protein CEUSTIGMA_g13421.t1 [Chlamydomonas eustigma]|eukprot:GAX86005.1 hypothetical protein CEUSTIGMA_g13421.t1 [Chlamydomonas eustigma]
MTSHYSDLPSLGSFRDADAPYFQPVPPDVCESGQLFWGHKLPACYPESRAFSRFGTDFALLSNEFSFVSFSHHELERCTANSEPFSLLEIPSVSNSERFHFEVDLGSDMAEILRGLDTILSHLSLLFFDTTLQVGIHSQASYSPKSGLTRLVVYATCSLSKLMLLLLEHRLSTTDFPSRILPTQNHHVLHSNGIISVPPSSVRIQDHLLVGIGATISADRVRELAMNCYVPSGPSFGQSCNLISLYTPIPIVPEWQPTDLDSIRRSLLTNAEIREALEVHSLKINQEVLRSRSEYEFKLGVGACPNGLAHSVPVSAVYEHRNHHLVLRCSHVSCQDSPGLRFPDLNSRVRSLVAHMADIGSTDLHCRQNWVNWSAVCDGPEFPPFPTDQRLVVIRACMGVGKTKELKSHLLRANAADPKTRILVLTFRRSLAFALHGVFNACTELAFQSYMDVDRENGMYLDVPRLIVQLDSLPLVWGEFDIVVIDEVLSVILHTRSNLISNHTNVIRKLQYLIKSSRQVVMMDANADEFASYNFVQTLERLVGHPAYWIHNVSFPAHTWFIYLQFYLSFSPQRFVRPCNRLARVHICNAELNSSVAQSFKVSALNQIKTLVESGKRVYAPCSTASHASELREWLLSLQESMPGIRFKVLTGETRESEKRTISENFTEVLDDLDIFVCSPAITAGPSFELKHFHHMVQFAVNHGPNGCTVDALLQQSGRVRILGDDYLVGNSGEVLDGPSENYCMDVYILDPPQHNPKPLESTELDHYLQTRQDGVFTYIPTGMVMDASVGTEEGRILFDTNSLSYACLKGCMYMLHKSMAHFSSIILSNLQEYGVKVTLVPFEAAEEDEDMTRHALTLKEGLNQRQKDESTQAILGALERPPLTKMEYEKARAAPEMSKILEQLVHEYRLCVLLYHVDLDDVHNDVEFLKTYVGPCSPHRLRKKMELQCSRLLSFEWSLSGLSTHQLSSWLVSKRLIAARETNSDLSTHMNKDLTIWKPAALAASRLLDLLVPDWRSLALTDSLTYTPRDCVEGLWTWLQDMGALKYNKLVEEMGFARKDKCSRNFSELSDFVAQARKHLLPQRVKSCRSVVDDILFHVFACKSERGAQQVKVIDLSLYKNMIKRRVTVDTSSKSEQRFTQALESRTGLKFIKTRPLWLLNPLTSRPMELDLFCDEKHVAIEYDGPQHYTFPNAYHQTREEFDAQVLRDQAKDSLCRMHGVVLIRIRCIGDLNSEVDEALLELKKIGIT